MCQSILLAKVLQKIKSHPKRCPSLLIRVKILCPLGPKSIQNRAFTIRISATKNMENKLKVWKKDMYLFLNSEIPHLTSIDF